MGVDAFGESLSRKHFLIKSDQGKERKDGSNVPHLCMLDHGKEESEENFFTSAERRHELKDTTCSRGKTEMRG
jgi:hypothetical protein